MARMWLIIGCLLFSPLLPAAEQVTVGVNHAPPYRIVEAERVTGFYVDLFEEMAQRLDWNVRYVEAPFRRILLMMEQGEVDVMLGPLKTSEREAYMDYIVEAFPPERRLFFYTREENRILGYPDLYRKRIGVLRGSRYFPMFDSDPDLLKEPGARYENLMRMLQRGYVDVVIAPELVGRYTIRQNDIDAKVSPFFVPGEQSWIAVSRQSGLSIYREDMIHALEAVQADSTYDQLLMKYLQQPGDGVPASP